MHSIVSKRSKTVKDIITRSSVCKRRIPTSSNLAIHLLSCTETKSSCNIPYTPTEICCVSSLIRESSFNETESIT